MEKAVTKVRQSEAVKQQLPVVRGVPESVEAIHKSTDRRTCKGDKGSQGTKPNFNRPSKCQQQRGLCTRCGKLPSHPKSKCPARDTTCHKCKKKGLYQTVCRSTGIIDTVEDDQFLGTIHTKSDQGWNITLELNGKFCNCKIDTGEDVTVISEKSFRELGPRKLYPSSRILKGPNSQPLGVIGKFPGTLCHRNRRTTQEIFVIKNLAKPLLGRPAIEQLQLISLVDTIEGSAKDTWIQTHPKLFQGLGRLKGPYTIQLKEGAKPYTLSTPRRVAIPLLPKVKEELQRMESLGVISKVKGQSEWCAGMVVVKKKRDGKVRICVDLTKLNQNVRRERHILPSVEQT